MPIREDTPYTKELLDEILGEGGAKLAKEYGKFNQRMKIEFICKCGEATSKKFEMLRIHRMPYCKSCSIEEHEQRKKKTCLEKHGVVNVFCIKENIDKINKTWINKYGDHPKRTQEVQDKWRKTCLEKYGGHPNQNKDVQEKSEASSYKFKEYITPNGSILKYQGYENLALDELFKRGYDESDIIMGRSKVPTINYTINGVKHVYFPDIYVKSENKIIEVKSDWTITLERANISEKAEATIKEGYLYEVWIYDSSKNKVSEVYCNEYFGC